MNWGKIDKRHDGTRVESDRRTTLASLLLGSCILVIVLHTWGAVKPLHENWGVHSFAFYPAWISGLALALSLVLLSPAARGFLVKKAARFAESSMRIPVAIRFLVVGGAIVGCSVLFPAQVNLLGDSDLIISLTSENPGARDLSANFRNQPLTYYALRGVQYALGGGMPVEVSYTYTVLDDIAGLLFLLLLFLFVRSLRVSPLEKLLIAAYLFFQTSLQLFLGYVENYALFSVLTAAFVIAGWRTMEADLHPGVAVGLFALMIGVHLGGLIFLPALLIILYRSWRRRKLLTGMLALGGIAGSAFFLYLGSYTLAQFINRMQAGATIDMLPLFHSVPGGAYAIFSRLHLIDWTNALLFLASFACFIVPILAFAYLRGAAWKSPVLIFLAVTTLCGLGFTFVFNSALGMARDWDLLVTFMVPVNFLSVYLLLPYVRTGREGSQILIVIVALNILRAAAWIGINADPDRHLERAEILTREGLSGTFPVIYYEALGKVFWHRGDFERSRIWYERYLTIDSLNPRILGNLAGDYGKLGMNDAYFESLKRAVRSGSKDEALYLNLGGEFFYRGDTARGIEMTERALKLNPGMREAHANLALICMLTKNYPLAAVHSAEAIDLGMHEPAVYKCAAYSHLMIRDPLKSLEYFDSYLEMAPRDTQAQSVRSNLRLQLGKMQGKGL